MLIRGVYDVNKRGISTLVTTVLIILLVLVVIGVIWVVVRNLIGEETEFAEAQAKFFSERIEIKHVSFDLTNNLILNVTLKKLTGSLIVTGSETISAPLEVDIMSVVDLSGSMNCSDGGCYQNENRCENICGGEWMQPFNASKDANKQLVSKIFQGSGESYIGLVGYDTIARNQYSLDLTDDVDDLNNKIDEWKTGLYTCICCGINEASVRLQADSSQDRMKVMIVMSDGDANRDAGCPQSGSPKEEAIEAACDANDSLSNFTIYSVGLGETVDEDTLKDISACGGGQYYSASNISNLISVYEQVADEIQSQYKSAHRFDHLKIVFYDEFNAVEITIPVPEVLIPKEYDFNLALTVLVGPIIKIEIYPVIITDEGKEIVGPLLDMWEA